MKVFFHHVLLASKPSASDRQVNGEGASEDAQCNFTVGLVCLVIIRERVNSVVLRMP